MDFKTKTKVSTFVYALTTLLFTANASAQQSTDSTGIILNDVEVVSVKKTKSNPLEPVSVITESEIERLDINAVKNIGVIVPNFYMPDYGSRMTSSIYVRGLGARIDNPVVGLTVDNVPILNKDAFDMDVFDIDRVEAVRGSVGILSGRNSIGGQINITTLNPWRERGFRALVEYGKANTARAGVGVYGKLGSRVASSLTASYNHTDGFYRNNYNGKHVGTENAGSARWKLSWHPDHSRWSLMNVASVSAGKNDGYPYESLQTGEISYNDSTYYRRTTFTDGLTVSYTGKRIVATSVTSVQYVNDDMTLDQDFLPEDYFTLSQRRKEWAWTQDIFAKGVRGQYSWLMGAFGFYKGGNIHAPVNFKNTGLERLIEDNVNRLIPAGMQLRFDERNMLLDSNFKTRNGGFAIYHQSSVTFGKFIAQIGLRWDIEHIALDYRSDADAAMTMYRQLPTGAFIPLATQEMSVHDNGTLSKTYNQILPQASIGYNGDTWQVSARVAKGYKAGGYNTQMFSDILQQQLMEQAGVEANYDIDKMLTYKPERAWTYELTGRYSEPKGRFSFEAVLFLMKIRDQQLTVFPDGNTGRAMTNAGRTRSMGVEITTRFAPCDNFTLTGSYGFTNAVFTKYDNGQTDLKGNHLPYAPSNTMFIAAVYSLPQIGNVTPSIQLDTRGAGKIYWDDENTVSQNFYATLGASVILDHKLGSLTLWGENLTSTKYNTFYFESIGHSFVQRARPITFGATLRLHI